MVDTNGKSAVSILDPLTTVNLDPEDSPWDEEMVAAMAVVAKLTVKVAVVDVALDAAMVDITTTSSITIRATTWTIKTTLKHTIIMQTYLMAMGTNGPWVPGTMIPLHINTIQTIRAHPHAGDARGLAVAWPTHPTKGLEAAWLHHPTKGLEAAWPHHPTKGLEMAWPHRPTHGAVTWRQCPPQLITLLIHLTWKYTWLSYG